LNKVAEVRRFIDEYSYATGRNNPFLANNLPETSTIMPIVSMPKEMLIRFRNDYRLLVEFAAYACGTTVEKLCPFDLLAPFLRDAMREQDTWEEKP